MSDPFCGLNEEHFTFIYSTNILVRLLTVNMKNCLTPKNPKMYSQSSRENVTPSSGTSPLAYYKEVPPPPPGGRVLKKLNARQSENVLEFLLNLFSFF